MQLNAFSSSAKQPSPPKQKHPKFGVDLISMEDRLRRESLLSTEPQDSWDQAPINPAPEALPPNNIQGQFPIRVRIIRVAAPQGLAAFLERLLLEAAERRRQLGILPPATLPQNVETAPAQPTIPFQLQNGRLVRENLFELPPIPESLDESDWEDRDTSSEGDSESLLSRTSSTNAFDDEEPRTSRWRCLSRCTIM